MESTAVDSRNGAGVQHGVGKRLPDKRGGGMEAEDIVADAIKLNVDDELNEQRDEHASHEDPDFAPADEYDEPEPLDNSQLEDEPNYEEDDPMDDEPGDTNEYTQCDDEEPSAEDEQPNGQDPEPAANGESADVQAIGEQVGASGKPASTVVKKAAEPTSSSKSKSSSSSKTTKTKSSKTTSSSSAKEPKKEESSKKSSDSKSASKSKSSTKEKSSKDSKMVTTSAERIEENERTLWVSGLTADVRASELEDHFNQHGTTLKAKIIRSNRLPIFRYYGVVVMETSDQAVKCIQKLDRSMLCGRLISVDKNRLSANRFQANQQRKERREERRAENGETRKLDESRLSREEKPYRERSPRRDSASPTRRFTARPYIPRSATGTFPARGRGGTLVGRPPYAVHTASFVTRKLEAEREIRRRERERDEERRRSEVVLDRRQRELEREQMEEREKLEREKLRLKLERERLEREKADFLRMEREKARMERERIEREREELRRKAAQLPHRLDETRSRGTSHGSGGGRSYDDAYAWDDRKRFAPSAAALIGSVTAGSRTSYLETASSSTTRYADYGGGREDEYERRKLDTLVSPTGLSRTSTDYDSRRPLDSSRTGHDRDERRAAANGSSHSLAYFREPIRSGLVAGDRPVDRPLERTLDRQIDRPIERERPVERSTDRSADRQSDRSSDRGRASITIRGEGRSSEWKSNQEPRRESRFLDKPPPASSNSYLSGGRGYGQSESRDEWQSSNERLNSASGIGSSSSTDRPRMIQIPVDRPDPQSLYSSGASSGPTTGPFPPANAVYRRY